MSATAETEELLTDLGNARRIVRLHGDKLRYFKARGLWYVWDGKRWRADDIGAAIALAKSAIESLWDEAKSETDHEKQKRKFAFAAASQSKNKIESALALAQSEPGIAVRASDLDSDPWLLNVQNGVVNLRNGELAPHDRDHLMTKVADALYDPEAKSELWDGFIETITKGDRELAAYIQRALGYALFGAWQEKAFWFGYGPPDGGKSTLLGVVGDVLGDYHVSADASTWMVQHNGGGNRGDVTRLLGARLVTTVEVRDGARFDEQLVKKVTGGDEIVAAAKYEHEIEFKPTFALWLGANDQPIISENDEGMWGRVRCVPFTNPVPKDRQDKELRAKLTSAEHAPAVLAWLVRGCIEWQRVGIGSCRAVDEASRSYRKAMNRASVFFDECIEVTGDEDDVLANTKLRSRYEHWCGKNGVKHPLQGRAFSKSVRELGATGGDDSARVGGIRVWRGVRIRPDCGGTWDATD